MNKVLVCAIVGALCAFTGTATAGNFQPGAPGIGDPYFPLAGNGGYDVGHYTLDISYDPATDHLDGVATIEARATENLSSFNLDFHGLNIQAINVDWWSAGWTRDADELTVTPKHGLKRGQPFTVVVRYEGVPGVIDAALGPGGVFTTDDGMLIIGEPDVAAAWFPVNDHPSDKASYTIKVTVPEGLEAVSNGYLQHTKTKGGKTTFVWQMKDPMASYLATAVVGKFMITSYRRMGCASTTRSIRPSSAPSQRRRQGRSS